MNIEVVVLAAGHGTRMNSKTPKVLHEIGGKPMLMHVLDATFALNPKQVHVVVGADGAPIETAIEDARVNWVVQEEQRGTGHAVKQSLPHLSKRSQVLVTYGDCPLISTETLSKCVHGSETGVRLISANVPDPTGFGRIVRDQSDQVQAIVEQSDLSENQNDIREINSGVLATSSELLRRFLPNLSDKNAQNEFYLTDVIAMAIHKGISVHAIQTEDYTEVLGVNDQVQLAAAERIYQKQQAETLMRSGVTLSDPARFDQRGSIHAGQDCRIDINVVLEGHVELGDNVSLGPNCVLRNVSIGANSEIKANSVIEDTTIGQACAVGPFARIRPGSQLGDDVSIGNFVEIKNSQIQTGVRAGHLTYLGDAEIGADTNVGAGTITCNFDGKNKNRTIIGDDVFIGSNSSLVAPLTIGSGAFIAAGSTINREVNPDAFAIERSEQRNVENSASRILKR